MKFGFYDNNRPAPAGVSYKISSLAFFITVFIILGLLSFWLKWPALFYPDHIRGNFLDLSANPDGTVWILTDGTFRYTESYNETSFETKGLFCKNYLYHYDPIRKKVLQKITIRFRSIALVNCLYKENGRLWQISRVPLEPLVINAFEPETGAQLWDVNKFSARFDELKSGIAQAFFLDDPGRIQLETKDGRKFVYLVGADALLPEQYDLLGEKVLDYYQKQGLRDVIVLAGEDNSINSSRQVLYRVDGIPADLCSEYLWPINKSEDQYVHNSYEKKFSFTRLTPDQVYLEPIMLYRDQELAVFLHQDQIGSEAKRSLTCITAQGIVKWTVPPEKLFPQMMLRKDDTLSGKSFIKSSHIITGTRQGNLLAIKVKDTGAIGLGLGTGKELWRVK